MPEKRLKILFLSSWYPNRVRPLNGIFVQRHAEMLVPQFDVSTVYICSDNEKGIEIKTINGVYTVIVYFRKVKRNLLLLSSLIKFYRYTKAWKKALAIYRKEKGKPDIIHSNIVYPVSIIAAFLKLFWRIPYVITEHWSGYFPEDGRYRGFVKKIISKIAIANAGAVITPSIKLSKTMQKLGLIPKNSAGKNGYFVIPNVVDTEVFQLAPINHKSSGYFNFIHISSLSDEKNVIGIIRAFNKFHKLNLRSKLTIIWDEEEKEFLAKLKEEPFSEYTGVFLFGKKVGLELAGFLQNADAFILFSNFENLPVVMLESFCCGLPFIGTRVGDVPEYINKKNGILVEPKNEEQLLKAMEKIYSNSTNYNSEEIRKMIIDKVSPSAISKQFTDVYNIVLKPGPVSGVKHSTF